MNQPWFLLATLVPLVFCPGCGSGHAPSAGAQPPQVVITPWNEPVRWERARPRGVDRMLVAPLAEGERTYRALWSHEGVTTLVVFQQNPLDLFGAIWNVYAYDANGRLWKTGMYPCQQDETPVGLVEVKSSSPELPAAYRDRWILGMALVDLERNGPAARGRPWVLPNDPRAEDDPDHVCVLSVEPVRWGQDGHTLFRTGTGILYEPDESTQFRGAEAGLPDDGRTHALPFRVGRQ